MNNLIRSSHVENEDQNWLSGWLALVSRCRGDGRTRFSPAYSKGWLRVLFCFPRPCPSAFLFGFHFRTVFALTTGGFNFVICVDDSRQRGMGLRPLHFKGGADRIHLSSRSRGSREYRIAKA